MEEVNITFEQLEEGNEFAMREYLSKLIEQLRHFVELIKGDLKKIDRSYPPQIGTFGHWKLLNKVAARPFTRSNPLRYHFELRKC